MRLGLGIRHPHPRAQRGIADRSRHECRRALGRVLDEHIAEGAIDERTAIDWAERMLWRNSEAVYAL